MTTILQKHQLGEIIKLEYGKPLPQSERQFGGEYPVYGANGIISRTDLSYVNHRSIIIGRKGSAGELNLTEKNFWPLDVTYFVTFDEKKYDLGFLYRLLTSLNLPKLAKGVKPGLNRNDVYSISVTIPELIDEQKRIAQVIDAADALRQKRKQAINLLDDYLKSVFLEMFGDPLSNRKKLPVVKLEDIATKEKHSIVDGPFGSNLSNDDYLETGIPIIRINNVRDSGFYNDNFKYISEKKYNELIRSKVQYNDILIPRVGNSIGKVCIYNQRGKALLSTTGVAKVTIDPKIADLTFVVQQMRLPDYSKYIWNQTEGGGQPYLNLKKIKSLVLMLPELKLQKTFSEIAKETELIKMRMITQSKELETQFQALMQKTFKGQL